MTSALFEICKSVFAAADIEKLLPFVLDLIIDETQAERCRIVLFGKSGGELFNRGRRKGQGEDDQSDTKISRQIIALVKSTEEVFVTANAMLDPRLEDPHREHLTVFEQGLLSVVCAPLRDQNQAFGVVYIDNRNREKEVVFDEKTGELLNGLAALMSEALRKSLEHTLKWREETENLQRHIQHLREEVERQKGYGEIIGASAAMKKIYEYIDRVKMLNVSVLITGETGTGKELVARTLHRKSNRAAKNFVAVDCSTLPENMLESELFGHEKGAFTGADKLKRGRIEEAHGGTLFLDEIGNLNMTMQEKLLRFLDNKKFYRVGGLQEQEVDARLLFATNKNLQEMVDRGTFKSDLHFRLTKGVEILLPPFSARGEDILLIAAHFLSKSCEQFKKLLTGFSPEARECLLRYSFPGNARELEKVVANAVIFAEGPTIGPQDLPEKLRAKTVAAPKPDEEIRFNFAEPGKDNFYAQYLPEQYSDKNFIWGLASHLETEIPDRLTPIRRELHDTIILSVKHAFGLPLTAAVKAAANAFERNFMIAKLLEAKGKVTEAALRSNVDKKTFIEKMKLTHKLKKEWYVE